MNYRVSRLCAVACDHAYFVGVEAGFVRWEPDPRITGTLAGQRLLFRSVRNGFELFYEVDTTLPGEPPALSIDPGLTLTFIARAIHPAITPSTEPLPSPATPFLLGNAVGVLEDDVGRLHPGVTVAATERVRLVAERTLLRYASVADEVVLRLEDAAGVAIVERTVQAVDDFVEASVDLTPFGDGPFTVLLDGTRTERLFVGPALLSDPPLALAQLIMRPVGPGVPILAPSGSPLEGGRNLAVHFATRATTWRYVVVPRSDPDLEQADLAIQDTGPDGFEFLSQPKGPLPGGVEAVVFESTAAIPFRAAPYQGLELQSRVGDNPDLVTTVGHLPNPRPGTLSLTSTGDRPVSEVFVYL